MHFWRKYTLWYIAFKFQHHTESGECDFISFLAVFSAEKLNHEKKKQITLASGNSAHLFLFFFLIWRIANASILASECTSDFQTALQTRSRRKGNI